MAGRLLRHEHVAIKIHGSQHQQMRRQRGLVKDALVGQERHPRQTRHQRPQHDHEVDQVEQLADDAVAANDRQHHHDDQEGDQHQLVHPVIALAGAAVEHRVLAQRVLEFIHCSFSGNRVEKTVGRPSRGL